MFRQVQAVALPHDHRNLLIVVMPFGTPFDIGWRSPSRGQSFAFHPYGASMSIVLRLASRTCPLKAHRQLVLLILADIGIAFT